MAIGNDDWKIVDGYLVKKVYVAQILRNDAVAGKYETLVEVLAATQKGDTVQLLQDVSGVDATIESHLTVFAAERSRRTGRTFVLK